MYQRRTLELIEVEGLNGKPRNNLVCRITVIWYNKQGYARVNCKREFPELVCREMLEIKDDFGSRKLIAQHLMSMRKAILDKIKAEGIQFDDPASCRSGPMPRVFRID